jgi:hypothetical protein
VQQNPMSQSAGNALFSNPNFGINSIANRGGQMLQQQQQVQQANKPTWNSALPGGGMGTGPALGGGLNGGYTTGRR